LHDISSYVVLCSFNKITKGKEVHVDTSGTQDGTAQLRFKAIVQNGGTSRERQTGKCAQADSLPGALSAKLATK
jgi:hypothetical protein